ncbi:sigma factor-like helix-turn-helix DNA-binding protein [Nocardia australiensis]|uniref:sigma factor-like helix-turn-helix DNA-binding protein n=1 Tax=Nocardia australiensis TaxID=2887191 RepID=UPI001D1516A9|nr:sigma factor-like helix-turn-helix DNA-binding protein [Nocardia australiensis]
MTTDSDLAGAASAVDGDGAELDADDIAGDVSFGLEEVNELLGELVEIHRDRSRRDAEIVGYRLGISGQRPETLARIGARYDLSRDRIRQLHTRAVGQILREAQLSGHRAAGVFARRYPVGSRDQQLVRALLVETYATDTDIAANELAYLKLRLAGHAGEDARRVAGFVMQRIMAWQKKTNRRLAKLHNAELLATSEVNSWLGQVDWPASGTSAELPLRSARTIDRDDDGRGRFYLDKVGRDVAFDSGLEARLLRVLNASELVDTFREQPSAVEYALDGVAQIHYPSIVARLADGRVVLIDVEPLGHIGFHVTRAKSAAARTHAHANGWGWLVWTGSRSGIAELHGRSVDRQAESRLRELVDRGPVYWPAVAQWQTETELDMLDFIALVLRNEWRWERAPFRLTATR